MYQKWLNVLGRHFFGRQQAGKRVRLSINRKFLDEHFAELGGTSAFVESLKEGPLRKNKDERSQSMYDRGITLFRFWKNRAGPVPDYIKVEKDIQGIPEYLPYLCLLCLAWTEGEEEVHVAHAFYDRLETLYPYHDLKGRLGDWCVLWEELEEWTKQKKGSHGLFVVERLGGMSYVGIPKSQVIFTPNRIESLPALFAALNLQP